MSSTTCMRSAAPRWSYPQLADATAAPGTAAAHSVLSLLDSALEFAKIGRTADAGDRAFDAYIAFEPLETPARARQPGLVASMERHFADFKGALRGKDLSVAVARTRCDRARPADRRRADEADRQRMDAFFQSFLIILREGFEAILVIGAVVAFLHQDRQSRSPPIDLARRRSGLLASAVMAVVFQDVFAHLPASKGDDGRRHDAHRRRGAFLGELLAHLESRSSEMAEVHPVRKSARALDHGGGKALALVAFLAVFREGAETALFYQALFSEGQTLCCRLSLGIVAGFAALAVIFTLFYRFGVKIPMRPFFTVTSVLLYYMAFVFMGKGIRELQEGNVVPITVMSEMPSFPSMGIFPSLETSTAQGILLLLFVFMIAKTFMPSREATA